MNAHDIISKIESAGFHLALDGSDIVVTPPGKLTDTQRQYLKDHKPDILDALRSAGSVLDTDQAGNDMAPANDDHRVLIHVPDLGLASGQRISCDMTVPAKNLDTLRAVLRFKLRDDQGGGSLLGSPGASETELRGILTEKYGQRLATIDGAEVTHE